MSGSLRPSAGYMGRGGDGIVCGGVHVVPPEEIGAGEVGVEVFGDVPEFGGLDECVGLSPEFDFAFIAEVPTVADDTVV